MIYWIGWWFFRLILRVLGRWEVVGAENVPPTGPLILAANHISFADPPAVGAPVRRKCWFMAKEELFRFPPIRWLLRKWQAFPVRRGSSDLSALKKALQVLSRGEPLIIFPEGTRQSPGRLGAPEMGVGMIAVRSGAPVVPVFVSGTDRLLPKGSALPRLARVRLRYGPPVVYPPGEGKPGHEEYAAAARSIMEAIGRLANDGVAS